MELKIFRNVHPGSQDGMPHNKFLIIDGLIAFAGSANLTQQAWRKLSARKDHIEVVTDVQKVAELNNRLFSPNWASIEEVKQPIDLPPK